MFLRLVQHLVKTEYIVEMSSAYERKILSELRITQGCVFASLLQNVNNPRECISLTIWESQRAASLYEESGLFPVLLSSLRPYFVESNDWELKLSDDLSIEYTPIPIDPSIKGFNEQTEKEGIPKFYATPYAAKIITLTVQPEKIQEFQDIFASKIIPKFKSQKGFIHIILLRKSNEFNIVSFWDETIDLNPSMGDSNLDVFSRSIFEILPSTVQWQVSHKSSRTSYASSDEIKTSMYRCLTGEWFSKKEDF
jgi:heme-degrading monooxygenase HmoA